MAGSALTCCSMRKALSQLCGARCLKPYPGKPDVRNFRGAAGNVVYGGTAHPPAIERAGPEKPPPKDARASSLPNKGQPPTFTASRVPDIVRCRVKRRQRHAWAGPLSLEIGKAGCAEIVPLVEGNTSKPHWRGEGRHPGVEEPRHMQKHFIGTWEVFRSPRSRAGPQRKGGTP